MSRKFISFLLAILMVLMSFQIAAFADDGPDYTSSSYKYLIVYDSSHGTGSVSPEPIEQWHVTLGSNRMVYKYLKDTEVTLTANPNDGYYWDEYDTDPENREYPNPATIKMDQHKWMTMKFEKYLTISVVKIGTGNGNAFASPVNIKKNTKAHIEAYPNPDSNFDGWYSNTNGTRLISRDAVRDSAGNLDQDVTYYAKFSLKPTHTLSVSKDGTGTGSVTVSGAFGGTDPSYTFLAEEPYQTATITAAADTHSDFTGWSGDLAGINASESLLMDDDKAVTATFVLKKYLLEAEKQVDSTGDGTISGTGEFDALTSQTLVATPDAFSWFDGWYDVDGNRISTDTSMSVTMTGSMEFQAKFMHYSISFEKWIHIPWVDMPEQDAFYVPPALNPLLVKPSDAQFNFRLQSQIPVDSGTARSVVAIDPYDKTVSNDANGMVTFTSDPDNLLVPGLYKLTETDDPNDGITPGIGPDGLLLYLNENNEFERMKTPKAEEPSFVASLDGQRRPFVVINVEDPNPELTITKSATPTSVFLNEDVTYTIELKNTGNVPIWIESIEDDLYTIPDEMDGPFGLLPGEAMDPITYSLSFSTVGSKTNTVKAFYVDESYMRIVGLDDQLQAVEFVEASKTVQVSERPSTIQTFTQTSVTNVSLALTIEGPGSVVPGSGAYSLNSVVQFSVTPDVGAVFAGWFGENGKEVSENRLAMNADKAVTARFTIPEEPIPEGRPVVEPVVVPTPDAGTTTIETPVEVPQAAPQLPKTAGFPVAIFYGIGTLLIAVGARKKK